MTRIILLLLAMTCVAPVVATAQQASKLQVGIAARPQPSTMSSSDAATQWKTGAVIAAATHWKTGAVIGSAVGLAAVVVAVGAGSDGGSASLSEIFVLGSIGILLGGVPGALIGGLFKK